MKKVYIAPTVATYEICTDGIMALSTTDKGNGQALTQDDIDNGDYEVCTNKKEGIWGSPKKEGIWDSQW